MGMVLGPAGETLAQMLTPFRLGLGGGAQSINWITVDDPISAIYHTPMTDSLQGRVNVVGSSPVISRECAKALGHVLRRSTLVPLPASVIRVASGELTDELLLANQRVYPARLLATGYQSRFPELEDTLRHLLGN